MPVVAQNPYSGQKPNTARTPSKKFAISPSDSDDVGTYGTTHLWSGAGGAAKLSLVDDDAGDTGTVFTLAANTLYPFAVRRVWATGTSATGLVGLVIT